MGADDSRKLFVGGLAEAVTEHLLREVFEGVGGKVDDVSVPQDRESGRTRGFGFVTLASAEDAERAREALDGSIQLGRAISVRPFTPDGRRDPKRSPGERRPTFEPRRSSNDQTVFVGRLPYDATEEEVAALFQEVGTVQRVVLPLSNEGAPRGFGFVTLESAEAVQRCIEELSEAEVRGRRLVITPAHSREEKSGGGREPQEGRRTLRSEHPPLRMRSEAPRSDAPPPRSNRPPPPDPRRPRSPRDDEAERAKFGEIGPIFPPTTEEATSRDGRRRPPESTKRSKKKEKAKKDNRPAPRRRGGAGNWQRWEAWEEDD